MVLHGDVLDPEILEEAKVAAAETVVAVTNDDESNILASLLAKRYGCPARDHAAQQDDVLAAGHHARHRRGRQPQGITVSTILQHVRRGRIHAVHSLREGFAEVIEAEALETSSLVGTPLREIKLPPA